jgi:hypothetical protein
MLAEQDRAAAEHRALADAAFAAGDVAAAIRHRFRAVIRGLEERGLLDPQPGRTVDEAAAEAAAVLPEHASPLQAAVGVFDDVWYGGRAATVAAYRQVAAIDDELQHARPTTAGTP